MAKQFQHGTSHSGSIKRQRLLPFLFATTMPYQLVFLKIQSAPKCPTRGRRSATGKSSPCGIVRKTLEKFASIRCADCLFSPLCRAAYVLICKQEIFPRNTVVGMKSGFF